MKFARIRDAIALPLVSTIIILIPILVSQSFLGTRALFNYLAADSMYYAGIANNFVKYGFPTSDGLTTTNGFQPLWGLLLMVVFKVFHVTHDHQLYVLFGLSAICVLAAYAVLSFAFYRVLGLVSGLIATLTLFPGFYAVLFEPTTRFGSDGGILYELDPWSSINGVESPLVLLMWSLLFLLLSRNYTTRIADADLRALRLTDYFPPSARWCLAAILLCRLEQGLVFVAIAVAALAVPAKSWMERLRDITVVVLPSAIVAVVYVTYNMIAVGVPLPVSGLSKVHFGLMGNLRYLWHVMIGGLGDVWWFSAVRLYPLMFGAFAGIAMAGAGAASHWKWLPLSRYKQERISVYLIVFGLFILMNSAFLLIFEPIFKIGYWYYWPMILIPTTLASFQLGLWTKRIDGLRVPALLVSCAVLFFQLPDEMHLQNTTEVAHTIQFSEYQDVSYQLWAFRHAIRDDILRRYPDAKIVDTLDGVFGFVLDLPARSYTGLVSSPTELKRRQEVGFWRSAVEDGFDIVPNYGYFQLQEQGGAIEVAEEFRPESSPVTFYRVRLH